MTTNHTPTPVRNLYNATGNKFDPRRWRRQIRILERAILRKEPTLRWLNKAARRKYLRGFYATTRGMLRRAALAKKVTP